MSKVREYAVRISNVAYGVLNDKRKVIITFGEEIEERLKRNHINYIYAEPSTSYAFANNASGYIKFYGFDCAKETTPFMNDKFWAKYDFRTHSIRYASKAIVKMFNPFLGEYNNFYDNKMTITEKANYELFHINMNDRSGYSVVSSRRGSTMSIAPGERNVKLGYDKDTEERIKELNNVNNEEVYEIQDKVVDHDMRTMYPELDAKYPLTAEVERIKDKLTHNLTMTAEEINTMLKHEESKNAFLEHHPLDLDVKDEFVPNDERYKVEFLADWASDPDFELFPQEKTVQRDIEKIMDGLEKEMDELQERLNTLVKRYQKLNFVYVALTGHLFGDDLPKELYVMSTEAMPGGKNGEAKKSMPNRMPTKEF